MRQSSSVELVLLQVPFGLRLGLEQVATFEVELFVEVEEQEREQPLVIG